MYVVLATRSMLLERVSEAVPANRSGDLCIEMQAGNRYVDIRQYFRMSSGYQFRPLLKQLEHAKTPSLIVLVDF